MIFYHMFQDSNLFSILLGPWKVTGVVLTHNIPSNLLDFKIIILPLTGPLGVSRIPDKPHWAYNWICIYIYTHIITYVY
jgi:hypothetical protein